jgi:hypothetical protein
MKRLTTIVFGLLLTSSLTATAAYAQNSPPNPIASPTSSPIQISRKQEVIKDAQGKVLYVIERQGVLKGLDTPNLGDRELWIVLLLTMVAGGFGGFVFELLNLQGNVERKHDPTDDELAAKFAYASPRNVVDLGVRARIIIGMFAAPPAMLFLQPESVFGLIAMSVVAGSAGTGVFRALQDRLLIAVAQNEKEQAETKVRTQTLKLNAKSITPKLTKALEEVEKLENYMRKKSECLKDPYKLTFHEDVSLDPTYFSNVWKPLNEAKGIEAKTVEPSINAFKTLEQEVCHKSKSKKDTPEITIPKGKTVELKYFFQVKKLLNEAKGAIEAIENSSTPLEESKSRPLEEDSKTPQSESHKGQNALFEDPAHVN